MTPILLLSMLIFILCWLTGITVWIITAIYKYRLRKLLGRKYPTLDKRISFRLIDMGSPIDKIIPTAVVFAKFWSIDARKDFWDRFVDVEMIEKLDDREPHQHLERIMRLTGIYCCTWWIMIISIIAALIVWPS